MAWNQEIKELTAAFDLFLLEQFGLERILPKCGNKTRKKTVENTEHQRMNDQPSHVYTVLGTDNHSRAVHPAMIVEIVFFGVPLWLRRFPHHRWQ